MEVILLEKVENLGNLGDRVNVKPGYGRNFLIPSGKAAELEKAAAESLAVAEARLEKLMDMTITIAAKAGEEGKLFGSVGAIDIAEAIVAAGVEIERSEVRLPEGAFRNIGEYKVQLHLHSDVNSEITLIVEAE